MVLTCLPLLTLLDHMTVVFLQKNHSSILSRIETIEQKLIIDLGVRPEDESEQIIRRNLRAMGPLDEKTNNHASERLRNSR